MAGLPPAYKKKSSKNVKKKGTNFYKCSMHLKFLLHKCFVSHLLVGYNLVYTKNCFSKMPHPGGLYIKLWTTICCTRDKALDYKPPFWQCKSSTVVFLHVTLLNPSMQLFLQKKRLRVVGFAVQVWALICVCFT